MTSNSSSSMSPPPTQLTPSDSDDSNGRDNRRRDETKSPLSIDTKTKGYGYDEVMEQSRLHRQPDDEYSSRDEKEEEEEEEGDFRDSSIPKPYTPNEEKAVVKKFDSRLVLFVALLYMLSFLDRSNIGNAKIAGLEQDLHLTSSQYEWLLTAFYITYVVFEWMTLMYRIVPPHIYISVCVFSWGLIASLQSLATSFWSLVILRALLGISEAAFGPGVPYYLSFFFKREELAFRTGLFISAAPLATSFASSLAWVIVKLSQGGPVAPWRALFLAEGFPSVAVAVFAFYCIPDRPADARYLTSRERKIATLRLVQSGEGEASENHHDGGRQRRMDWRQVGRTLADPKCYLTAAMFFGMNVAFSSLPVFLPTIIRDMGYSALTSQALSAPPYLLSFAVVLLTSSLSDRLRTRSIFIIFHAVLAALGYAILCLTGISRLSSPPIRYLAIYPATAGFFSAITIIITWTVNNQPSSEGKGTGMAVLNIIGQLGPLVGVRLFPAKDKPFYVQGMGISAVFMAGVAVLAWGLRWWLARENAKMDVREKEDGWELFGARGEEESSAGEGLIGGRRRERKMRARNFRYML